MCSPLTLRTRLFSVGKAMGRNKLIYALSERKRAVAAGQRLGRTWQSAPRPLKRRLLPGGGHGEDPGRDPATKPLEHIGTAIPPDRRIGSRQQF